MVKTMAQRRRGQGEAPIDVETELYKTRKRTNHKSEKTTSRSLTVEAPDFGLAEFGITGIAPYVQNKFSAKARQMIRDTQEAGSTSKKGKKKEAKDFQDCYEQAQHKDQNGCNCIPAPAFRNAMVSACRMVGFKMTHAKLSVFVETTSFDADDGTPLVPFTHGKPTYHEGHVRLKTGVCDIRARPFWQPGWKAKLLIRFDKSQFTLEDVTNLLVRAGLQVGIGEGRPDSRDSCGMGWGLFEVDGSNVKGDAR